MMELEFKGTKGEWIIEDLDHRGTKSLFIESSYGCIGTIWFNEKQKYNAKLISAAPDLLEALQEILKWSSHFPEAMNEDIIKSKQAIEKALK